MTEDQMNYSCFPEKSHWLHIPKWHAEIWVTTGQVLAYSCPPPPAKPINHQNVLLVLLSVVHIVKTEKKKLSEWLVLTQILIFQQGIVFIKKYVLPAILAQIIAILAILFPYICRQIINPLPCSLSTLFIIYSLYCNTLFIATFLTNMNHAYIHLNYFCIIS